MKLPYDASTHGHLVDEVLTLAGRFDVALLIAMVGLLTFAVLRFGRRNRAAPQRESMRSRTLVLGVAVGIFLVVDGSLLFGSERALAGWMWNPAAVTGNPRTVRIEVNAHQWAWDFRHAGVDGRFNTSDDPLSWNEVRIPVGRPVHFQLASTDVIHGFNLPHFRSQVDVIPGRVHQVWIEAKETGSFELGCSNHCGTGHYRMRGVIHVLSDEDFEAWQRTASERAVTAHDPDDPGQRWGWEWRQP